MISKENKKANIRYVRCEHCDNFCIITAFNGENVMCVRCKSDFPLENATCIRCHSQYMELKNAYGNFEKICSVCFDK